MAAIYDEAYYTGRGADPLVDYVDEASTRRPACASTSGGESSLGLPACSPRGGHVWLDFGCGAGGLVQFLRGSGIPGAVGYEPGWAADWLANARSPRCPIATSTRRRALRRGDRHRGHRACRRPGSGAISGSGRSCAPVDSSSSPPATPRRSATGYLLAVCHARCPHLVLRARDPRPRAAHRRLRAWLPGFGPGWAEIIRFKTLKSLGRHRRTRLQALVPWSVVAPLIDRRLRLSASLSGGRGEPGPWRRSVPGVEAHEPVLEAGPTQVSGSRTKAIFLPSAKDRDR